MQNIRQYNLKTEEEFYEDLKKALRTEVTVKYLGGEINCYTDKNYKLETKQEVMEKLSELYNAKVKDIKYNPENKKEIYVIYDEPVDIEAFYRKKKEEYDTEDVLSVIDEDFNTEDFNKEQYKIFLGRINIKEIVEKYNRNSDANIGVWDNIRGIIECFYEEKINQAIKEIREGK